jgi:2-dehydro-3-deoxygluconokinase
VPDISKNFDVITFGEIMLRLSPPGRERIMVSESFNKHVGGSELNVSSGISLLGLRTGIISKIPDNAIGTFVKDRIRFCGVSDDYLIYDSGSDARLGLYYYENGAYPRKPAVVYDRRASSVNSIEISEIPGQVFSDARVFHTSGITLALSSAARAAAVEMIKRFKKSGALISFDVNYRANLWGEDEARQTICSVLPYVDILFVSEESSRRMFHKTGTLDEIMKSYCAEYGISVVATTERKIISPSRHTFGSVIYSAKDGRFYREPPYENIEVIDRIGSGDAYVAGVLFGMLRFGDMQKALEFGDANSAVKNTVPGDTPVSDFAEIEQVIDEHKSKGYHSEMNR